MEIFPDLLKETLTLISFCKVLRRYPDAMDPTKPHDRAAVLSVLAVFPELAERRKQLAGSLSGGQSQMMAIGHKWMDKLRYFQSNTVDARLPMIFSGFKGGCANCHHSGAVDHCMQAMKCFKSSALPHGASTVW